MYISCLPDAYSQREELLLQAYEGRSKSFATRYDAQVAQA